MHGTRGAGAIWEQTYSEALAVMGFKHRGSAQCMLYLSAWDIARVVHGDEFAAMGTDASLNADEHYIMQQFEVELCGALVLKRATLEK